jgi:hypothetical protein
VICAGTASFAAGRITFISNESGHYAPSATKLANALAVLAEEGAELGGIASIEVHPGRVPFQDVGTFLAAHPPD